MNTRIALSTLSILAALGLMGGSAFAFFSNTGTSSSNTFSTGTLDLVLSDTGTGPETDQDSVTASFGGTLSPGTCTGNQTLNLKNVGTIAANHAEVKLANVVTDANGDANPDIDAFLRINTLTYDGVDVTPQFGNTNGTAFRDLGDWAASPAALDNLALIDLNVNHPLVLDVCLDSSAGNTLQGDSVTSTFTVNLNQDASQ